MKNKHILLLFLISWLVINLAQAYFTGLFNDEAYYFFYSRDLAWGYYDHPPLVALFIKAGYFIFPGELGVRLLYVILSMGTILIIHKLSEAKNDLLFVTMVLSYIIFAITGFLAIPDSILLFFTALFFLFYKKYSTEASLKNGLWLGLVMAGLLYSKYLGILVIFFTFLSNLKLITKKSFWLAVIITTVLFAPHLYWQYQHEFPTFYYHLRERSHDEFFRWSNFGDYIVGQLAQTNPFLFIPILYFLIIFKPRDSYERAMKFTAAGILLLPFLFMIKGRVEANWTMAGLIPLFLIAYRHFESRPKLNRLVYYSGGLTLLLLLLARIMLINNFIPEKYLMKIKLETQGWAAFSQKVSSIAENRPVVFIGSYQNPSQFRFYSGKESFSFNNALYRSNQYDLEPIEQDLQGREVMLFFHKVHINPKELNEYNISLTDSLLIPNRGYQYYYFEKNYRSYNFVKADILIKDDEVKAGTQVNVPVVLKVPGGIPVKFSDAAPKKVYLTYMILQYGKPVRYEKFDEISGLVLKDDYKTSFNMKVPEKQGVYYVKVSIKCGWMPAGINSRLIKIEVK
jgi:hypothetical protein